MVCCHVLIIVTIILMMISLISVLFRPRDSGGFTFITVGTPGWLPNWIRSVQRSLLQFSKFVSSLVNHAQKPTINFKLISEDNLLSWSEAEQKCNNFLDNDAAPSNSHLVSIVSGTEMEFLTFMARLHGIPEFWIGLTDSKVKVFYKLPKL